MGAVNYGKVVLIGAGHVGSAILDSLLRMNLADEIVVVNRNEKKALGVVMDASHTTAFAYSANASIRVGTYEDCKDAQIIINTAGPSIQPGNSRDRMVLLQSNVQVMRSIMTEIVRYTREADYQCLESDGYSDLPCSDRVRLSAPEDDRYRYAPGHGPLQ